MDTRENDTITIDAQQSEEENDVDVSSSDDQPDSNTTNTNITASPSGLQQIEDDGSDLPLSMGMAEAISNTAESQKQIGKVEQIDDDDDVGPAPPAAMEASLLAADRNNKNEIRTSLASINSNDYVPTPFNSAAEFDEDTIAKKKDKEMNHQQNPAAVSNTNTNEEEQTDMPLLERESVYIPASERFESMDEIQGIANTEEGDTNQRVEIESRAARDIESQTRTDNNDTVGSINDALMVDAEANAVPISANEGLPEVEAYLVEDGGDGEVYDATPVEPTLPWWKQRRTRILIGLLIVLVGALVVALGVSLSQSNIPEPVLTNSTTVTVFVTPQPTISIAPSSSIAPSTSPPTITYECFNADDGGENGILYKADQHMDVSSFDTSSVTNMWSMFNGASSFRGRGISNFNTSSVTTMDSMFWDATVFNGDISSFNTSSVTNMHGMFRGATSFNRDLSNFDTSSVTSFGSMFYGASLFNGDVSNFDTSSIATMDNMFYGATAFNGDVSNFNTSRVTSMAAMFAYASRFNGDVTSFNTSSVRNMYRMFYGAASFNNDLCLWRYSFPYTRAEDIFTNSSCTYQSAPKEDQKGPFCASTCQ